jgi:hypothetical protein
MRLGTKVAAAMAMAAAFALGAARAQAAVIDWTLTDGAFSDGASFSGSFRFDSDADAITDWNVTTTTGLLSGATYASSAGCSLALCSLASDNGSGPSFENDQFVVFSSVFSLTNIPLGAPGMVAHLTGNEAEPGPVFDFSRTVSDGEAVGVLSAAPEPATWALMIGGFGLAGAMLRRRRAFEVV